MVHHVEGTGAEGRRGQQGDADEDVADAGSHLESEHIAHPHLSEAGDRTDEDARHRDDEQDRRPRGGFTVDSGVDAVDRVEPDLRMQPGEQRHHARRGVRIAADEPAVEGRAAGLDEQRQQHHAQRDPCLAGRLSLTCQNREVDRAGGTIDESDADEQHRRGQQVDHHEESSDPEPAPGAGDGDERVGGQHHHFDEDEEVEQITGQQRTIDSGEHHHDERRNEPVLILSGGDEEQAADERDERGEHQHERSERVRDEHDRQTGHVVADGMGDHRGRAVQAEEPDSAAADEHGNSEQEQSVEGA